MEPPLSTEHRKLLLDLARAALTARLHGGELPSPTALPEALWRPAGVFVSLHIEGRLRGCIGHVVADDVMWRAVRSNAVNAAFHDPRFEPLTPGELEKVEVEISVLTPMTPLRDPGELVVGRDGLMVRRGPARGLLLPQVATQMGWSVEEFLDGVCRKAGLPRSAWRDPGTEIDTFQAEVFSESAVA